MASTIHPDFFLEAFSHADIAVTCALRFVGEAHPSILAAKFRPALAAHAHRFESTELFQRIEQPLHVQLQGQAPHRERAVTLAGFVELKSRFSRARGNPRRSW